MSWRVCVTFALALAAVVGRVEAIQYQVDFQGNILIWGSPVPGGDVGPYDISGPPPGPPAPFMGSFVYDPATPQSHFLTTANQAGYQHALPGGFQLSFPTANGGAGVNILANDYLVEVFNDFPSATGPTDFFTVEFNTALLDAPFDYLSINDTPYNGFYGDPPTGTPTGRVKIQLAASDATLFDTNTSLPGALSPSQFGINFIGGDITEIPGGPGVDVLLSSVGVTAITETFIAVDPPNTPPPTPTPEPSAWQIWLFGGMGLLLFTLWRRRKFLRTSRIASQQG